MSTLYHNLQIRNIRKPASWQEFIKFCNDRGVKIIKNTQTHWWDITTPRYYRVVYIQNGCTNSDIIKAVNEDDIRAILEGVQIVSIEVVENTGQRENIYLVWYRAVDKTLNRQTITAKNIAEVYRIFEGIEIVSIEANNQPGTRGNI